MATTSAADIDFYKQAEIIYNENQDKIDALEKRRRYHLGFLVVTNAILALVLTPVVDLSLAMGLKMDVGKIPFWILFTVIYALLFYFWYLIFDENYRHRAKYEFMQLMAGCMNLRYQHNGVMNLGVLRDHRIMPHALSSTAEEGFKGWYKDFKIEFQDFRIILMPGLGIGRFDYRSLLWFFRIRGVAVRIALKKTLEYHTVLMPSFMANGFMKRYLNDHFHAHEVAPFGQRPFKKRYSVLSTDPAEAHYIFDPAVVERIMTLEKIMKAQWLEASFRDKEFVIYAQYAQNFFEIGHLLSPVNVLTIERVLREMNAIKGIIDILELNPYAGLGAEIKKRPPRQGHDWPQTV